MALRNFSEVGHNVYIFYTYILKGRNNFTYVGSSKDLALRLKQHNKKQVSSTSKYIPMKVAWYAAFETKDLTQKFEKYLKLSLGFAFRNKRLLKHSELKPDSESAPEHNITNSSS